MSAAGRWGEPQGVVSVPLVTTWPKRAPTEPPRWANMAPKTGQHGAQRGQGGPKKRDFSLVAAKNGFSMLFADAFLRHAGMSTTDVFEVANKGPFLGPPGLPGRSGAPRRPLARAFLGHVWYVFS